MAWEGPGPPIFGENRTKHTVGAPPIFGPPYIGPPQFQNRDSSTEMYNVHGTKKYMISSVLFSTAFRLETLTGIP